MEQIALFAIYIPKSRSITALKCILLLCALFTLIFLKETYNIGLGVIIIVLIHASLLLPWNHLRGEKFLLTANPNIPLTIMQKKKKMYIWILDVLYATTILLFYILIFLFSLHILPPTPSQLPGIYIFYTFIALFLPFDPIMIFLFDGIYFILSLLLFAIVLVFFLLFAFTFAICGKCFKRRHLKPNQEKKVQINLKKYTCEFGGIHTKSKGSECCMVCLTDFEEKDKVVQMPCNKTHIFHSLCIQQWLIKHATCPICRSNIV